MGVNLTELVQTVFPGVAFISNLLYYKITAIKK